MNAIYKIIGDDGKEYGPVSADQIRQWIAGGRIDKRTPIFTEGAKDWSFVGLLPEFANDFDPISSPPPLRGSFSASHSAKTNSYAQAGMIFGILSMVCCCCGFPFGVLGLIFSLIGLSQINSHPESYQGRGMAIAGLVLSIVSLVMGAASMLFNLALNQPHVMWNAGSF